MTKESKALITARRRVTVKVASAIEKAVSITYVSTTRGRVWTVVGPRGGKTSFRIRTYASWFRTGRANKAGNIGWIEPWYCEARRYR